VMAEVYVMWDGLLGHKWVMCCDGGEWRTLARFDRERWYRSEVPEVYGDVARSLDRFLEGVDRLGCKVISEEEALMVLYGVE